MDEKEKKLNADPDAGPGEDIPSEAKDGGADK